MVWLFHNNTLLKVVYVFYQLCSHASSREYVRDQTEVGNCGKYVQGGPKKMSLTRQCWKATFFGMPCSFECLKTLLFYHINVINFFVLQATPYLLDLLHDRNPEVQRVCDATLQLIGEVGQ